MSSLHCFRCGPSNRVILQVIGQVPRYGDMGHHPRDSEVGCRPQDDVPERDLNAATGAADATRNFNPALLI